MSIPRRHIVSLYATALIVATVVLVAAAPATRALARSGRWHKNTFHVTHTGVFNAYFLMPKWFEVEGFSIWIVGPKHASHCTLRHGTTTDDARKINLPAVDFWWPEKGLASATRAKATCHVAGGGVTAATVFLPLGMRESRITLRRT
jgi:hypothetical protein